MIILAMTVTDYKIFDGETLVRFHCGPTAIIGGGGTGKTVLFKALRDHLLHDKLALIWPEKRAPTEDPSLKEEQQNEGDEVLTLVLEGRHGEVRGGVFIDEGTLEVVLKDTSFLEGMKDRDLDEFNKRLSEIAAELLIEHPHSMSEQPSVKVVLDGVLIRTRSGKWQRLSRERSLYSSKRDLIALALLVALRDVLFPGAPLIIEDCLGRCDKVQRERVAHVLKSLDGQIILFAREQWMTGPMVQEYFLSYNPEKGRSRIIRKSRRSYSKAPESAGEQLPPSSSGCNGLQASYRRLSPRYQRDRPPGACAASRSASGLWDRPSSAVCTSSDLHPERT